MIGAAAGVLAMISGGLAVRAILETRHARDRLRETWNGARAAVEASMLAIARRVDGTSKVTVELTVAVDNLRERLDSMDNVSGAVESLAAQLEVVQRDLDLHVTWTKVQVQDIGAALREIHGQLGTGHPSGGA